jgi:hypothetical protein
LAEPPRKLSLPPGYEIPPRRPNRGRIMRRRLLALLILGGLIGLLYLAVHVALDRGSHGSTTATTTVVKPSTR